jgi:hypothetical protein
MTLPHGEVEYVPEVAMRAEAAFFAEGNVVPVVGSGEPVGSQDPVLSPHARTPLPSVRSLRITRGARRGTDKSQPLSDLLVATHDSEPKILCLVTGPGSRGGRIQNRGGFGRTQGGRSGRGSGRKHAEERDRL